MGLKHLLLLLLTALLVEVSLQSAPASGAGVALRKAVKRDLIRKCGREFQKIVIYACGASRWKKMAAKEERSPPIPRSAHAELDQTDSNEGLENVKRTNPEGIANPIGSDLPQVKYPRRKRAPQNIEYKCCVVGCTYQEIVRAMC
ncbi:insulin-like peptide INSL5 [Elgaria multicarinata webbii]|uniref:insulin-like peptide INSL5 n=1 Tax=Elgaria multicarinata webbii TaxID=159646 RepID=UPI002FCCEF6F